MIQFYNSTVVVNGGQFQKDQIIRLIYFKQNAIQVQNTETNDQRVIILKFVDKNIAQSSQRVKLQFKFNQKLLFKIQKSKALTHQDKYHQQQWQILSQGSIKFTEDQKENYYSQELVYNDAKIGFLTTNFDIFNKDAKLINEKTATHDILLFSIKMNLIPLNDKKRFYIVIRLGQSQERMVIKGIQKDWIVYQDVLKFCVQSKRQLTQILLEVYSFDSKYNSKQLEGTSKTSILTNFHKSTDIKFQQLDLLDSNNVRIGKIQFKYCLNDKRNQKTVSIMNSRKYVQNSISPSKLIQSISPVSESLSNQLYSSMTSVKSINSFLIPHHKNKASNSHLTRRKNYSMMASNNGIAIGLKQRFDSPKILTNSYCYYAHKTLDARELPQRQIYKFSSFGFSSKPCLKNSNQRKKNGPGPGGYRLPSIFDRYAT